MSGISQEFPNEAIGPAVGVFIYTTICFTLSSALLWATIAHREWKSYVALLAFFTTLSTLASMGQQLHTYLRWTTIKLEQFDYVRANADNPELSIAGASVGIDIVFFYIQFYCYNVESIFVVAWCTQLAHSIYRLKASHSATRYGAYSAKTIAILLPIIQVSLLRSKALQSTTIPFYFVANIIMGVSLALGIVLLLAILARYVATRAETSWHVEYGDRSTVDNTTLPDNFVNSLTGSGPPLHRRSIYDNWLVVRFTLAFAGLAAFQLIVIMQEVSFATDNSLAAQSDTVNLLPSRAVTDTRSFLPGVSASLLAFIVFGTTKAFREYFYRKLVPRPIRRKIRMRSKKPSSMVIQPPPPPRRPSRGSDIPGFPLSPDLIMTPRSTRSNFFELNDRDLGAKPTMGMVYEMDTNTPTHSTFPLQKKEDEEDRWPILNIRPQ